MRPFLQFGQFAQFALTLAAVALAQDETPAPKKAPLVPSDSVFGTKIKRVGPPLEPWTVDRTSVIAVDAPAPADGKSKLPADDDYVFGLVLGGEARAYPMDLVSDTEVINDTLGGTPVAITWCMLCQAAIVYRRTLDERTLTMGNARTVASSNMLMYDVETASFWQQATGVALTGSAKGRVLAPIASWLGTWAEWRRAHPKSTVVEQTSRDLKRSVVLGFDPERLERMGLVVRTADATRFYPFNALAEVRLVEDEFAGVPLAVVFDGQRRITSAWSRVVGARTVHLSIEDDGTTESRLALVEQGGGARWDAVSGEPVAKAGAEDAPPAGEGGSLTPIVGFLMHRNRFKVFFPDATIYRAKPAKR